MDNKDVLIEWYDTLGEDGYEDSNKEPENHGGYNMMMGTPEKESEEESPEKKVDKIEKGAELHKAMAMSKALDNKLALLSGVFSGFADPEKRKALKAEVREIAKRIVKILDEDL